MSKVDGFIKKRALLLYFVLVFGISWGAILLAVGLEGLPAPADQAVMLGMALLLGPSIAGLLITGLTAGRAGFRELCSRLLRWRVGAGWYALALLTAPLSTMAVLLLLSFYSHATTPAISTTSEKGSLILMGIGAGFMVAFFEELGWTGYAIPRMRQRSSILWTGVLMGLIWGAWHFPPFWQIDSFKGALPLALLIARLFSWLLPFRVLMVWIHDGTQSLLVTVLMHMSLVATTLVLDPILDGAELLAFLLLRTVFLWAMVGAVLLLRRRTQRKALDPAGQESPPLHSHAMDAHAG